MTCSFTSNVTALILERMKRKLLSSRINPITIVNEKITKSIGYKNYSFPPETSVYENFDSLLIPKTHVSRSSQDTYYLTRDRVLRTHTSCHQESLIKQGVTEALVPGDVYRRDEVDKTHYPVFHQLEGFKLFTRADIDRLISVYRKDYVTDSNPILDGYQKEDVNVVCGHLRETLETVMYELFGKDIEMRYLSRQFRWIEAYFPFTTPSFELEVFYNGKVGYIMFNFYIIIASF